jgi:poly(hydroxyalkanoate) granule-associated protein
MAKPRSRSRKTSSASANNGNGRPRAGAAGATARAAQEQLMQAVQQVWLAGMGAIARAQKEGPAGFQEAVAEGIKLFSQSGATTQRRVRDVLGAAQETLQSRVGGAREQAQETWDNLEALFQSRVQRAMHQLGVPTADEIRELSRRVAELNETVVASAGPQRAARKTGAKRKKAAAPRRAKAKKRSRKAG